nr:VCBS repeat-containing protein [Streptomyces sp. NBC_00899]
MALNGPARRLLAGTVALVLASGVGPLAVTATAESTPGAATPSTGSAALAIPPGSEILSAGPTGFLTNDRDGGLLWTRYADGAATALGSDRYRPIPTHGYASDVVALERGTEDAADHRVELHDMAAGTTSSVALGTTRHFLAAVGTTVAACRYSGLIPGVCKELHLLDVTDGVQTDRTVTGLPADTTSVAVTAAGPGSLALRYETAADGASTYHYAVVDVLSGAVALSHVATPSVLTAVTPTHMASIAFSDPSVLAVEDRATGQVTRFDTNEGQWPVRSVVGLTGDWAVFGAAVQADDGSPENDMSLKAVPLAGGTDRRLLDHATSLTSAPDGALLVMGGTVAQGEGLYRISAGSDGAPAVDMVARTGLPTAIGVVSSSVPAVATLDTAPWKARWQLSRGNADVFITLRHTATGAVDRLYLSPTDDTTRPVRMDFSGRIFVTWDGLVDKGSAPNGDYTWQLTATPSNGLGPALNASGTFKVSRKPAPHDYTDNGSPDLLARDSAGVLWREDTIPVPGSVQLTSNTRVRIGGGWNAYNRVVAVGDVGGISAGDLVARDSAGVLWLYLGTGTGTFTARTRIGGGWNIYNRITGMGDFSGDGRSDLVARDSTGVLWLYRGTGNWRAPYLSRTRVGGGWNLYDQIVAVGNVGGISAGDLVARDSAGVLWLYLGTGTGTFTARTRIGGGWNIYTQIIGVGDSNVDGRPDIVAEDRDGSTWRYRGTGSRQAPFTSRDMTGALFVPRYTMVV